jgi:hypothetical protein
MKQHSSSRRALMMEKESTSEMLVNFYQTTKHNIPEDISPFLTMV